MLLGVSGDIVAPRVGGGLTIRGGASITEATTNAAFGVQQTRTSLVGSEQSDVIYARNPERMPSGTHERLIDVRAELPDAGIIARTATITNLPPGFAINNATQEGDRWVIQMNPLDPNHLQIELRYALPADGTRPDVNGFLSNFVLNILFSATDDSGFVRLYAGSQTFVTREVQTEADVKFVSGDGESTFYALNATPPGTVISAGGGDDTVYAGAGHDLMDGGAGNNTLSYAYSDAGVTVDLAAGTGRGGYADGDVLRNFQNIEGSNYADNLVGTSGDNIFIASRGADNIIGNGGSDTVDYAGSAAGVTVDLATGFGQGGLAEGDRLAGISNVIGSATGANLLAGTAAANRIVGGGGNDTITGAGGADTLTAGAGDDVVTYTGAETLIEGGAGKDTLIMLSGADVDLRAADQTGGDRPAVSGFENVDATAVSTAMSVIGTAGDNRIATGGGNDTIDGGGGIDVIHSGDGNDSVAYHGEEISLDGGTGNNTLVLRGQVSVNLAAVDQTLNDGVTVSRFTNVDATALTSAQPVTITGNALANRILGGQGDMTVDGGGGADAIVTGAGNDRVTYRGSENLIDAGGGTNTLVLQASADIDLSAADQTIGDLSTVARFTNVDGSQLDNGFQALGTAGANTILGGRGEDVIDGGGGADMVLAGAGDDMVTARGGETRLDGGSGNDTLVLAATSGVTQVDFAVVAGVDQTTGDTATVLGFENLDAHLAAAAMTVTGSLAGNIILTGSGADTIDGRGGADQISAGAGDDTVRYYGTEVLLDGGSGTNTLQLRSGATINLANSDQTSNDFATVSGFTHIDGSTLGTLQSVNAQGSSDANVILGGAGADVIDGGGGTDTVRAGAGDDTVSVWGSESLIEGGAGNNTLVLRSALTVDLSAADVTVADAALVRDFDNVNASQVASAITITGNANANRIVGGAGADRIDGAGGADIVDAGAGNDTVTYRADAFSIDGGTGNNTLVVAGASTLTMVNFTAGFGVDQTVGDAVEVTNFSNVDARTATNGLAVIGSSSTNMISTGSGNDTIQGGGGLDVIDAGGGDDIVDYHGSESAIDGGSGSNTLRLLTAGSIDLSAADQSIGDIANVTNFINIDASSLTQGATLAGSSAVNLITGGAGADVIDGGGGADVINAGAGNDIVTARGTEVLIDGQGGSDTLLLNATSTISNVDFSVTPARTRRPAMPRSSAMSRAWTPRCCCPR